MMPEAGVCNICDGLASLFKFDIPFVFNILFIRDGFLHKK